MNKSIRYFKKQPLIINILDEMLFLYIFIFAVGLGSCTKDLDITPVSSVQTVSYFNDAASIESALTGGYYYLQMNSNNSQYYQWKFLVQDARADNWYSAGNSPLIANVTYFAYKATDWEPIKDTWLSLYKGISSSNLVLDNIGLINDPKLTESRKSQIIGEAKFLRALHYFNLVKLYGGVPLQLTASGSDEALLPKAPLADVYAQIEKDLIDAEVGLPASFGAEYGRATKGAAQALLAKVYAQQHKYESCSAYCDKVINSKQYSLLQEYDWLFDGVHPNNSEIIFQVQHVAGTNTSYNWAGLYSDPSLDGNFGWTKFMAPSHDIIRAFNAEKDEVRFKSAIVFNDKGVRTPQYSNDVDKTMPFVWKTNVRGGTNVWNNGQSQIFIRLADIILLKAEALNRLGKTAEAITLMNTTTRKRANLSAVSTALSQDAAALAILKERRLELVFEGERYFDLLRFGNDHSYAIQVINSQTGYDGVTPIRKSAPVDENRLLYPISIDEINANPNLKQNPGW